MKHARKIAPERRLLIILAIHLAVMLAALLLWVNGQVAGWVSQVVVLLCLCRLAHMAGWGAAKNGMGWRI